MFSILIMVPSYSSRWEIEDEVIDVHGRAVMRPVINVLNIKDKLGTINWGAKVL